jgi:hypothetical protein
MEEHRFVQTAGLIARFFRIDPVQVVDSGQFEYAFRAAAFNYVQRKEEESAEKAKREQERTSLRKRWR